MRHEGMNWKLHSCGNAGAVPAQRRGALSQQMSSDENVKVTHQGQLPVHVLKSGSGERLATVLRSTFFLKGDARMDPYACWSTESAVVIRGKTRKWGP